MKNGMRIPIHLLPKARPAFQAMRIYTVGGYSLIIVTGVDDKLQESKNDWDELSATCLLQFVNTADGIHVEIKW